MAVASRLRKHALPPPGRHPPNHHPQPTAPAPASHPLLQRVGVRRVVAAAQGDVEAEPAGLAVRDVDGLAQQQQHHAGGQRKWQAVKVGGGVEVACGRRV